MKSLTNTAVLFMVALLLTAVVTGAYAYFFIKMKDRAELTINLNTKVNDLEEKEKRIASSIITMRNESASIKKLSAYYIKESEVVLFTKKIEALGKEAGVKLSIESLESGVGEKGATTLNFRLKAKGDFQDVVKLVALLENFPAKFDWKSVRMVRVESVAEEFDQKDEIKNQSQAPKPVWSADISLVALNFIKE